MRRYILHYSRTGPLFKGITFLPHRVAANSQHNKMTLTNLATIFGPNLLRPGGAGSEINVAAMDVVTPVSVVLYYLNCPEEYFDEGSNKTSPDSTAVGGSGSGGRKGRASQGELGSSPGGAEAAGLQHSGGSKDLQLLNPEDPVWKANRRSRRASGRGSKVSGGSVRVSSSSVKSSSSSSLQPSRESVI